MSILNSILITAVLAGNLFAAAYDSSESQEKRSSCGRPVLRPCACVIENPCEVDPSDIKRNFLTAEDVQKNIQTNLLKESDLSGQGIKGLDKNEDTNNNDKNNDETKPKSIDGGSTPVALGVNEDSSQNFHCQVCVEGDSIQRLDILETPVNLASGCKQLFPEWQTVRLSRLGISKFEKGWYRLKDTSKVPSNLTAIYLDGNNIVQVTSNIMNELSEYITWMNLDNNKIERLEEGCFENERIFSLSLTNNLIGEIENNAFKMPALYQLSLDGNRLKDTQFVSTLPISLASLNLDKNEITEISANSFSNLKKLGYLNLSGNKLIVLRNQCLRGATSISQLLFSNNQITTIEPGAFEDINPFQIFLDDNNISSIENGTFKTVTGLRQLNLERNKLTKVEPDLFEHLQLGHLQLAGNNIT